MIHHGGRCLPELGQGLPERRPGRHGVSDKKRRFKLVLPDGKTNLKLALSLE